MARIHSEDEEKPNEFHKTQHIGRSSGLLTFASSAPSQDQNRGHLSVHCGAGREIAKDRVEVTTLAKGDEDPHFVVPRPSFIGKLRQADLLIINGASLEIGFVPPLIRQANNPRIMPGAEGLIDLSQAVELIEKPDSVSRSEGDIHPKETRLHYRLAQCPGLARAIADALVRADRSARGAYQKNLDAFLAR